MSPLYHLLLTRLFLSSLLPGGFFRSEHLWLWLLLLPLEVDVAVFFLLSSSSGALPAQLVASEQLLHHQNSQRGDSQYMKLHFQLQPRTLGDWDPNLIPLTLLCRFLLQPLEDELGPG